MIQQKLYLLISIAIISFFIGCKKYPDDPTISLRTVKQRLEAEWQITKIEINGDDATHLYNDSLAPYTLSTFYFWFIFDKLQPNPNKSDNRNVCIVNKSSKNYKDAYNNFDFAIGGITFDKKYTLLGIGIYHAKYNYDSTQVKIFQNLFHKYTYQESIKIDRLYRKDLKIQFKKNNSIFKVYFKRTQR